jgi:hypothetical protein
MKCLHRKVGECSVLSGASNAHDEDFAEDCTCRICGVIACSGAGDEGNIEGKCVEHDLDKQDLDKKDVDFIGG